MDPRERFSSPQEAMRAAVLGLRAQIWTALPGILVSFDATKMTAEVQPAVKSVRRKQDGELEYVTLPVLPDVPVQFPHGGGYTLTLPIVAGDEVMLVFQARNMDGWWDQGDVQNPLDRRMHDLSDAICIPGPMSKGKVIENVSTDTAQLRADDGEITITLDTPNKVLLLKTGDVEVKLDGDADEITMKASTKIRLETPLVQITGAIEADGEIGGKVGGDNISLTTHIHSNVRNGPDESGPPVDDT